MDKAVEMLAEVVLRDVSEKGLENVDLWYIVSVVSSMMKTLFARVIQQVLESLDFQILKTRDSKRYRAKRRITRSIQALSGAFLYCRRYYKDKVTGKRVFLLDEALGIDKRVRLSPELGELCAGLNALGLSYRGVADVLELVFGERVMSHQEIREHTIDVAEQMKAWDEARDEEEEQQEGKKSVPILFIEADGYWLSRQQRRKLNKKTSKTKQPCSSKFEVYAVMTHEGWEKRYVKGEGESYRLKSPRFHVAVLDDEKKELWEKVRGELYRTYSNLDDTQIVINGDGAAWIRNGADHFRKAIYQYDRFHISRDLRAALRGYPQLWKEAKSALDANRIEELHPILAECLVQHPVTDDKRRKLLVDLISRIETDAEYIVDYRRRVDRRVCEKLELRGLGAAEPSVKRFKHRMKSVGKAWSDRGADAMAQVLARYFGGGYADYLDIITRAPKHQGTCVDTAASAGRSPASAGQIRARIKGGRVGAGAIRGSIAPLRPGYSAMARMFRNMTA